MLRQVLRVLLLVLSSFVLFVILVDSRWFSEHSVTKKVVGSVHSSDLLLALLSGLRCLAAIRNCIPSTGSGSGPGSTGASTAPPRLPRCSKPPDIAFPISGVRSRRGWIRPIASFRSPTTSSRPVRTLANWFENWLRAKPNRTLIHAVGRDFDASPRQWRKIQTMAPASRQEAIADLRGGSGTRIQSARQSKESTATCRWFTLHLRKQTAPVSHVTGDLEWLHNLDPSQMEVEVNSRMSSRPNMEASLESDEGLIVGRLEVPRQAAGLLAVVHVPPAARSVVANGSSPFYDAGQP